LGVLSTVLLVVIAVTGILLNHKRPLGLMPDVPNEPSAPFSSSRPLHELAGAAMAALPRDASEGVVQSGEIDYSQVDRMDVRPRDGLVKVRMRDRLHTEVTLDLATASVLHIGPRSDVFLEQLHSGEVFGGAWIILSDIAAVALVLTLITGYWLWLVPKLSKLRPSENPRPVRSVE
jgi:hypothetical protein